MPTVETTAVKDKIILCIQENKCTYLELSHIEFAYEDIIEEVYQQHAQALLTAAFLHYANPSTLHEIIERTKNFVTIEMVLDILREGAVNAPLTLTPENLLQFKKNSVHLIECITPRSDAVLRSLFDCHNQLSKHYIRIADIAKNASATETYQDALAMAIRSKTLGIQVMCDIKSKTDQDYLTLAHTHADLPTLIKEAKPLAASSDDPAQDPIKLSADHYFRARCYLRNVKTLSESERFNFFLFTFLAWHAINRAPLAGQHEMWVQACQALLSVNTNFDGFQRIIDKQHTLLDIYPMLSLFFLQPTFLRPVNEHWQPMLHVVAAMRFCTGFFGELTDPDKNASSDVVNRFINNVSQIATNASNDARALEITLLTVKIFEKLFKNQCLPNQQIAAIFNTTDNILWLERIIPVLENRHKATMATRQRPTAAAITDQSSLLQPRGITKSAEVEQNPVLDYRDEPAQRSTRPSK